MRSTVQRHGVLGLLLLGVGPVSLGIAPASPQSSSTSYDVLDDINVEWKWADFDRSSGFPGGTVREMVELGDTIYLRTDWQVLWFAGFEWFWCGPGEGLPEGLVSSIAPAPGGGLLAVVDGRIYRGEGNAFVLLEHPQVLLHEWHVYRAVPDGAAILLTARMSGASTTGPKV